MRKKHGHAAVRIQRDNHWSQFADSFEFHAVHNLPAKVERLDVENRLDWLSFTAFHGTPDGRLQFLFVIDT